MSVFCVIFKIEGVERFFKNRLMKTEKKRQPWTKRPPVFVEYWTQFRLRRECERL
jgi:hypothetical protein